MGDHGLWNRGNFSFNGKYPEFSSLKGTSLWQSDKVEARVLWRQER